MAGKKKLPKKSVPKSKGGGLEAGAYQGSGKNAKTPKGAVRKGVREAGAAKGAKKDPRRGK